MEQSEIKIPFTISALYILLIAFGVLLFARALINAFTTPLPPEAWPLIAGSLLYSVINSCVAITSGIAIYKKLRWGWFLAGSYLSSMLLGSILGFIQLLLIQVNGQSLGALYFIIVVFITSFFLATFLLSNTARQYMNINSMALKKYIFIILCFGFLLLLINSAIIFLASYLNMAINQ